MQLVILMRTLQQSAVIHIFVLADTFFCKSRHSRTAFSHRIVIVFSGYNAAYPSPGVIGITLVSGDEMAVAVHNSLASSGADIIPDIVPVRPEIILNDGLAFFSELYHRHFFLRNKGKIIRCMSERHYQQMTLGDREPVPAGIT